MCGICATLRLDGAGAADAAASGRWNDARTHRGPDDGGQHLHRHVGLGHRRLSILDHPVREFAARLPGAHKPDGTNARRILRAALRDEVPEAIPTRPKAGFPIPYRHWFATSLQGYLRDVLLDPRAVARDVVGPEAERRRIREQAEGRDHSKELFCLLVLEWWFRAFVDAPVGVGHRYGRPTSEDV